MLWTGTAFTEGFSLPASALPQAYADAFVAVASAFRAHAHAHGWNRTQFQLYLNNKPSFRPNTGVWTLDEHVDFLDFVGLSYFMDLFRLGLGQAVAPFAGIDAPVASAPPTARAGAASFDTRIDVSTRFVQHKGALNDGRVSLADINGRVYEQSGALIARRKRALNTTLWWYGADGSEGAAEDGRMEGIAGMLLAQWSRGCGGGLPYWESNGKGGKDTLAPLAIVVQGTQWPGYAGAPLPSVRLKVALAAQQQIELLNVLASSRGWSRAAVARAVCAAYAEALSPSLPCAAPHGGFGGLDLNALNYSAFSAQQLGGLRLRVLASVLGA